MIFDNTDVGRYIFILDINDGFAFRPEKYLANHADFDWVPYKLHHMTDASIIARFAPMHEWLEQQTAAFRINPVTMTDINRREAPDVLACMVQLPETLAVLFRLYWYDA